MESLIIISKIQFGYLVDAYKWCQHLRNAYDITFVCFDTLNEKIELDGIKVRYVSYAGPKVLRAFRYIVTCLFTLLFTKGKVLIVYFEKCQILKFCFPFRKMLLDIRTAAVVGTEQEREHFNADIKASAILFNQVSVISEDVGNLLGLDSRNLHVLPLGSDVISDTPKSYQPIRLLYVGTLNGRHIDKTILGLSIFVKQYPDVDIKYDIVGDGSELELLTDLVYKEKVQRYVTLHGRIPHNKLKSFFDLCNVGVTFIPITSYYNFQPPTKVYEYALSGLFQIATSTTANSMLINEDLGVLINDTSEDFAAALEKIHNINLNIDESRIRAYYSSSTWHNIVNTNLKPILKLL